MPVAPMRRYVGTYGYFSQGFSSVPPDITPALFQPTTQSGLVAFDGKGVISGTYTINSTDSAGGVGRGTFTGTYSVNSDCTGTSEVLIDVGAVIHLDLVVLSPTEYEATATDAGSSFIYSAKRVQAPRD